MADAFLLKGQLCHLTFKSSLGLCHEARSTVPLHTASVSLAFGVR